MDKSALQSLIVHMEWADAEIWTAVLRLGQRGQDGRLRQLLYHAHVVQRLYLLMWRAQPLEVPPEDGLADREALLAWARPYYPDVHAFLRGLDDEVLARTLDFPWAAEVAKRLGSAAPVTLEESILQVVLHSTYHRGQAATRIRELGGDPPLTDFIAWAWKERPAPHWTASAPEPRP